MLRPDIKQRNIARHPYKIRVNQGTIGLIGYEKVLSGAFVKIREHHETYCSEPKGQYPQTHVAFPVDLFEVFH